MNDAVQIEAVVEVDEEIVAALAHLVPQLSSTASIPTAEKVREIVESPCCTLLVARDRRKGGRIVGSLTMAVFPIPTGVRAWIEDVVVDSEARGRGVGEALNREALRLARGRRARTVELTSNPTREAANRLYRRLGFQLRETNVYRFSL